MGNFGELVMRMGKTPTVLKLATGVSRGRMFQLLSVVVVR